MNERRPARCEISPGVFAHRTFYPKRGICDDCGVDMRLEPMKPCRLKEFSAGFIRGADGQMIMTEFEPVHQPHSRPKEKGDG